MNKTRTPEEKQQQRDAARQKRQGNRRARINQFHEARSVAVEQVKLRYRNIAAPQGSNQLGIATAPAPEPQDRFRRQAIPRSWEILTEHAPG